MSKIFVADKLKIRGTKTLSTISLILILVFGVFAVLPLVNAHTPPLSIPTKAYINVTPDPAGVDQTMVVIMWLNTVPPTATGPNGDRWTFNLDITTPDGTTTREGPLTSDDMAGAHFLYTPTTVGQYTFQMSFPGQTLAGINPPLYPLGAPYVGDFFEPSQSDKMVVTVQQQPIQALPTNPLPGPNDYWQTPIYATNLAWSVLGGNWLEVGYDQPLNYFNPYTTAPNSAHIIWTKQFAEGGQIGGGLMGGGNKQTVYNINQYESAFYPAVTINGALYYNEFATSTGSVAGNGLSGIVALNLRTGQQVWFQNGTGKPVTQALALNQPGIVYDNNTFNQMTLGEVYNYVSPNQYGGQAYLWAINGLGSTLRYDMYDAFTGAYILSLSNCQTGTFTYSDDGSLLCYTLGPNGAWLSMWNASAVTGMTGGTYGSPSWQWRPMVGQTLDWRTGLEWNVTETPHPDPFPETISKISWSDGVILANTLSTFGASPQNWVLDIGYNTTTGAQMWVQNRTLPINMEGFSLYQAMGSGVYIEFIKNDLTFYCYNLFTGDKVWGPTVPFANDPGADLATFALYSSIAYGKLYELDYGGYVRCFDLATGTLIWTFHTDNGGLEWPGSVYLPIISNSNGYVIADGKIYLSTGHWYNPPMFNGAKMYCLDSNTGNLLYSVLGWWEKIVVADGVMAVFNGYDQQIYAFSKGLTATTVTATPGVGNVVTIQGTVTDQSPGQTCLGIPAAGTAAISDQGMSQWMQYLYMQQPKPDHATGVSVTLTAVDSNHATTNIGTTTSDNSGLYHIAWTPPAAGEYTILASFSGSNSYFASSAETGLAVAGVAGAASSSSSAPLDLYIIVATIVIIIAIAIAVIVLRRQK